MSDPSGDDLVVSGDTADVRRALDELGSGVSAVIVVPDGTPDEVKSEVSRRLGVVGCRGRTSMTAAIAAALAGDFELQAKSDEANVFALSRIADDYAELEKITDAMGYFDTPSVSPERWRRKRSDRYFYG